MLPATKKIALFMVYHRYFGRSGRHTPSHDRPSVYPVHTVQTDTASIVTILPRLVICVIQHPRLVRIVFLQNGVMPGAAERIVFGTMQQQFIAILQHRFADLVHIRPE